MNNERYREAIDWFFNGDVGTSSKTILAHMIEINWTGKYGKYNHPHDPSDFNRCLELLERFPEFSPRLNELSSISPYWAVLVLHWNEIENLMHCDRRAAYNTMQKIYDTVDHDKNA